MAAAAATGTARVELYTGPYGSAFEPGPTLDRELAALAATAEAANAHGLDLNAGHDLTVPGVERLVAKIPFIAEVSIGHALFSDALTYGMDETVRRYLAACRGA